MAGQSSWAKAAALETLLKNKPKNEVLAGLQRQAEEKFQGEVKAGKTQGILGQQAAKEAKPQIEGIYNTAAAQGERGRAQLAPALAALPANNPFRIAAETEKAAGTERLATQRARAEGINHNAGVAASQLPAFTKQSAAALLTKELSGLGEKQSALNSTERAEAVANASKKGEAAAKETATERRARRKEAGEERRNERSASTSRENAREGNATRKRIAEEKGEVALETGPKGKNGYLPLKDQTKAQGLYGDIYARAAHLHEQKLDPKVIAQALQQPVPSTTKENAEGGKETTSGHKGFENNGLLKAAVEEATYGKVSAQTYKQVKNEGYDPRRFRIKTRSMRPAPAKSIANRRT